MDNKLLEEIEAFYASVEKMDCDYIRPIDYIERYIRVTTRQYSPAYGNINYTGDHYEIDK